MDSLVPPPIIQRPIAPLFDFDRMAATAVARFSDRNGEDHEAVITAVFWARLSAVSTYRSDALLRLAELLVMHASWERLYGNKQRAVWADAEALCRFGQAADAGDEEAGARLATFASGCDPESLQIASSWETGADRNRLRQLDTAHAAAAVGDTAAITTIFDELTSAIANAVRLDTETMTILDLVSDMAAASGNDDLTEYAAEAKLLQAHYRRRLGRKDDALSAEVVGLSLLADLIPRQHAHPRRSGMSLATYLDAAHPAAVAQLAERDPAILAHCTTKGSC